MITLAIYMEGGGKGEGRHGIRRGMNVFLRDVKRSAEMKGWKWKLIACGSRDEARGAFLNARKHGSQTRALLLVDSEAPVSAAPKQHLIARDMWNLQGVSDDSVHLMAQLMETWFVADPETLAIFYGHDFNVGSLPKNQNLEAVPKKRLATALRLATKRTQKGEYDKVTHASALLERIRPDHVRPRCAHCDRLFKTVSGIVA